MERYDLLVAGGGPAGIGAAYAAAKYGAKVLLLERTGRLGGTAVQSVVSPLLGGVKSKIVPDIVQAVGGWAHPDLLKMDLQYYDLLEQTGVKVLLHAEALAPLMEGEMVTGLSVRTGSGIRSVYAHTVIDATGDGEIAFAAGVPFEMGRKEDGLTQPMSVMFMVGGIESGKRFICVSEGDARVKMVDGRTWESIVLEGSKNGELPPEVGVIRLYAGSEPELNVVNAAQINFLNGTSAEDLTRAEITCRRQAYAILDFLKKKLPGYANAKITVMPAQIGVRETRRFTGRARLTKEDCVAGRVRPDAVVRGADFVIDIHNPAGAGQSKGHETAATGEAETVKPYDIPYGAMIPEKVEGLLFAGRCISASHEALASCRVMVIAMACGVGAGVCAAYAAKHDIPASQVDPASVQSFLF